MRFILLLVSIGALFAQNTNTPAYPGSVATDSTMLVASNNGTSSLASSIASGATTLTVVSATNFTAPTALTIESEIVKCATLAGNVYSGCTRGWQGTTPAAHSQGVLVYENIIGYYHNQTAAEIKAMQAAMGANLSNLTALVSSDPAGVCPSNNAIALSRASGNLFICASGVWQRFGVSNSATLTFSSILDGTCQDQTFAFSGITTATPVYPTYPIMGTGLIAGGMWASATNTVNVRLCNFSGITRSFTGAFAASLFPLGGGYAVPYQTSVAIATTTYTLTTAENFIRCNSAAADVTVNLPAAPIIGETHTMKKIVSANTCILAGNGAVIDSISAVGVTHQYGTVSVFWDGVQWNLSDYHDGVLWP